MENVIEIRHYLSRAGKDIFDDWLTELADAANSHFEQLAGSFPPLADVQKHAAVAAFLRWAACSRTINDICAAHNGLTIDLSALGAFDLRDRNRTPTPDLDAR